LHQITSNLINSLIFTITGTEQFAKKFLMMKFALNLVELRPLLKINIRQVIIGYSSAFFIDAAHNVK